MVYIWDYYISFYCWGIFEQNYIFCIMFGCVRCVVERVSLNVMVIDYYVFVVYDCIMMV